MRPIVDFHHYRSHEIPSDDRVSRLERRVVDLLMNSSLTETDRDSSAAFELKHSSAVTQFARLLARKRGLGEDVCVAGSVLHDVYVIVKGRYKDHARLAEPIARELLTDTGFRNGSENESIIRLIVNHSDKHLFSDDPYIEFGKDADVLDCFLYPNAIEYYLRHKPIAHMFHYLGRAKAIWRDFGISNLPSFLTLLDGYQRVWLNHTVDCDPLTLAKALSSSMVKAIPSFLVQLHRGATTVSFNHAELTQALETLPVDQKEFLVDLTRPGRTDQTAIYEYFDQKAISLSDCAGVMVWSSVGILEPLPRAKKGTDRLVELTGSTDLINPTEKSARI